MFENVSKADKNCLLYALRNNEPSHAYLFYGGTHDVLTDGAEEFISGLVSASSADTDSHLIRRRIRDGFFSDLYRLEKENTSIKIESVRKIKEFLLSKPLEGMRRYILIPSSASMTEPAQNALLKLLEEPYSESVIILLAETADGLLDTILSRVQQIRMIHDDGECETVPLNMEQKLYLAQKFEQIFLNGDLNALFELSAIIAKDRPTAFNYAQFIYLYFLYVRKFQLNETYYSGYYETFRLMTEQTGMLTAEHLMQTALQAMQRLSANASIGLAVDAMLIEMQEEFHAENCRS